MMFIVIPLGIAALSLCAGVLATRLAERRSIDDLARKVFVRRMKGETWLSYRNRVMSRSLIDTLGAPDTIRDRLR